MVPWIGPWGRWGPWGLTQWTQGTDLRTAWTLGTGWGHFGTIGCAAGTVTREYVHCVHTVHPVHRDAWYLSGGQAPRGGRERARYGWWGWQVRANEPSRRSGRDAHSTTGIQAPRGDGERAPRRNRGERLRVAVRVSCERLVPVRVRAGRPHHGRETWCAIGRGPASGDGMGVFAAGTAAVPGSLPLGRGREDRWQDSVYYVAPDRGSDRL